MPAAVAQRQGRTHALDRNALPPRNDPGNPAQSAMPIANADDWGFASELEDVSGAVAIVGIGDADYTRASGRTTREIAAQATERALADAGLHPSDVDGLMYVPFSGDQFTARDFHAHFGTSHDLWESERGGGMVWAGSAPHRAAAARPPGAAGHGLDTFSVPAAAARAPAGARARPRP